VGAAAETHFTPKTVRGPPLLLGLRMLLPAVNGESRNRGIGQGKFATAANPLGFHVLAWTVPLEATPQPLPAKARTPNHFAQGRCRANTPMFGAGRWI
jgi:hypothetical protein